jgi:hypothetical protein
MRSICVAVRNHIYNHIAACSHMGVVANPILFVRSKILADRNSNKQTVEKRYTSFERVGKPNRTETKRNKTKNKVRVKGLETHCCLQDAAQIEDTNN